MYFYNKVTSYLSFFSSRVFYHQIPEVVPVNIFVTFNMYHLYLSDKSKFSDRISYFILNYFYVGCSNH